MSHESGKMCACVRACEQLMKKEALTTISDSQDKDRTKHAHGKCQGQGVDSLRFQLAETWLTPRELINDFNEWVHL